MKSISIYSVEFWKVCVFATFGCCFPRQCGDLTWLRVRERLHKSLVGSARTRFFENASVSTRSLSFPLVIWLPLGPPDRPKLTASSRHKSISYVIVRSPALAFPLRDHPDEPRYWCYNCADLHWWINANCAKNPLTSFSRKNYKFAIY